MVRSRSQLSHPVVRGIEPDCLPGSNEHRPISVAHARAARKERVSIADVSVSVDRNRGDVQFAAHGALVECLNVFELVLKTIPAQIDFVLRHRVKHEGVVWIGRMSERENGAGFGHARTLSAGGIGAMRRQVAVCVARAPPIASGQWRNLRSARVWAPLLACGPRSPARKPLLRWMGSGKSRSRISCRARSSRERNLRRKHCRSWSSSIRQHGIIQPLIVRQVAGRFELIAGERRWRAAQEAGLTDAPVILRDATDFEVLELSLIENLQRADLNPIEEAQGYARLATEFKMRQEDIAHAVGRSRAAVANAMRLLDLHGQIQTWLNQGLLSVGHAKVLLGLKKQEEQLLVAETILRRSATVRATERLVAKQLGNARPRRRKAGVADESSAVRDVQDRLQRHLATHVAVHHGEKRGRIEIEYYGTDDLQRLLGVMGLPPAEQ